MSIAFGTVSLDHGHVIKMAKEKFNDLRKKVDNYVKSIMVELQVIQLYPPNTLPTYWPLNTRVEIYDRITEQFTCEKLASIREEAKSLVQLIEKIQEDLIKYLRQMRLSSLEEVALMNEHTKKIGEMEDLLERVEVLRDSDLEKALKITHSFHEDICNFAFGVITESHSENSESKEVLSELQEMTKAYQKDICQLKKKLKSLSEYFIKIQAINENLQNPEFRKKIHEQLRWDILGVIQQNEKLSKTLYSTPGNRERIIESALQNSDESSEVEAAMEEYLKEKRKYCMLASDLTDQIQKIGYLGTKIVNAIARQN